MARKTYTGRYYVGDDPRGLETPEAAASLALYRAERSEDDCVLYVREQGAQGAVMVVRKIDGICTVQRLKR